MAEMVIWHDNGVPGNVGFSEYPTVEEGMAAMESMKESGITISDYWILGGCVA